MQELKFKHISFRAKPISFRLVEIKYITPLHTPVSGDVPIILMQLKYMTRIINTEKYIHRDYKQLLNFSKDFTNVSCKN